MNTSDYVIGFVDLLAVKNKIENDKDDKFLNQINQMYLDTLNMCTLFNQHRDDSLKIKIFSDNLVVAQSYDNVDKIGEALFEIREFLKFYQRYAFSEYGCLMRGYITSGKLYIDENFIYGQALLDAYVGESCIANYPRILIDHQLYEKYKTIDSGADFLEDNDLEYYLNFYYCLTTANDIDLSFLSKAKNICEKMLESSPDKKAMQKIRWQINYHNSFCKKHRLNEYVVNL